MDEEMLMMAMIMRSVWVVPTSLPLILALCIHESLFISTVDVSLFLISANVWYFVLLTWSHWVGLHVNYLAFTYFSCMRFIQKIVFFLDKRVVEGNDCIWFCLQNWRSTLRTYRYSATKGFHSSTFLQPVCPEMSWIMVIELMLKMNQIDKHLSPVAYCVVAVILYYRTWWPSQAADVGRPEFISHVETVASLEPHDAKWHEEDTWCERFVFNIAIRIGFCWSMIDVAVCGPHSACALNQCARYGASFSAGENCTLGAYPNSLTCSPSCIAVAVLIMSL